MPTSTMLPAKDGTSSTSDNIPTTPEPEINSAETPSPISVAPIPSPVGEEVNVVVPIQNNEPSSVETQGDDKIEEVVVEPSAVVEEVKSAITTEDFKNQKSEIIKTKSFELAVYARGDVGSSKLVLVLPGRLDTKDYAHTTSHVDFLAEKGYYALSFDPPGTWGSPGDISLYTITNYLKAIEELIEYFGNRPTVLMGHSRGGSVAMLAGFKNKFVTHIIAAMSNVASSKFNRNDFIDGIKISYRDMPPNDRENKKRFDLPLGYFEDAAKYDIMEGLRMCAKPKLFFLGTNDVLVKPEEVRPYYEEAKEPKTIWELNTEHNYRYHEDIISQVNNFTEEFLQTWNDLPAINEPSEANMVVEEAPVSVASPTPAPNTSSAPETQNSLPSVQDEEANNKECSQKGFFAKLKELGILGNVKKEKIREENLQKILDSFSLGHEITNHEVAKLLDVSHSTVVNYMKELSRQGKIIKFGSKSNTFYRKV